MNSSQTSRSWFRMFNFEQINTMRTSCWLVKINILLFFQPIREGIRNIASKASFFKALSFVHTNAFALEWVAVLLISISASTTALWYYINFNLRYSAVCSCRSAVEMINISAMQLHCSEVWMEHYKLHVLM